MLAQFERQRSATLEESGDGTPSQIAALEASDHLFKTVDSQSEIGAQGRPALRIPGYTVLKHLGEGGMGVVYLARQLSLDRLVALKTLHPGASSTQSRQKMQLEATTLARLAHPNVVQVFDVGDAMGVQYFALELMAGGSLEDRLSDGPLAAEEAAKLVAVLCGALEATHRVGIVHCDLKPANVLLGSDGTPKLADFGLARRYGNDDQRQTRTGTVRGTPSYMAPEQAGGLLGEFGPTVDVYALGGVLYELLTGRPPFLAATILETLRQVQFNEPIAPGALNPTVPRDLETICLKCLQKQPGKRYPTAVALRDDLRRYLDNRSILARRTSAWEQFIRWVKRHPSRAAMIGLSAIFLLAGVVAGVWFDRQLAQELDRTNQAQLITEEALVAQAAGRLDAELRELATVPRVVANAVEAGEAVRPEWLRRLVEADDRLFGIAVALEPGTDGDFALLAQRSGTGVVVRRLDQEPGKNYRQRDWYVFGKQHGNGWTEPYGGTDYRRTLMVSRVVPLYRDKTFIGVVVLDFPVESLEAIQQSLRDLLPGIEDGCQLTTASGTVLFATPNFTSAERQISIPSTGWLLKVSIPHRAEESR